MMKAQKKLVIIVDWTHIILGTNKNLGKQTRTHAKKNYKAIRLERALYK